jgi:thiol-disulfide isomerase/thioredoxin
VRSIQWKWWLLATPVAMVLLAALGFLMVRTLEMKIAESFKAPQIAERETRPAADYDFRYETLDGQTHRLSELRGKVVFANFWGTWCIRCVAGMPTIQKLYDTLINDPAVVFVVASRLDTPATIRLYAKYGHYDLPFDTIKDSDIPAAMQCNQYPTTFIFVKDGSLAETQVGGADWAAPSVSEAIRQPGAE